MTKTLDVSVYKGDHWIWNETIRGSDGLGTDIVGAEITFKVANSADSVILELDTDDGITIEDDGETDSLRGRYSVVVSPAKQTAAQIVPGSYRYMIRATIENVVTTLVAGRITVLKDL